MSRSEDRQPPSSPDRSDLSPSPAEPDERLIGACRAAAPGPTLICIAALHGNEAAGVSALRRFFAKLRPENLVRGEVVGIVGNVDALTTKQRFLEHDLNRMWFPERLAQLSTIRRPDAEDRQQLELDALIGDIRSTARGELVALDLHSTSGHGGPFTILDDTLQNRALSEGFGVPVVLGLEEEIDGTLSSHLTGLGVAVIVFEAGQHDEPSTIDNAEAAVWLCAANCGLVVPDGSAVSAARRRLNEHHDGLPRLLETRYRHALAPGSPFRMRPGFRNLEPVRKGQSLAIGAEGEIQAPLSGRLLLPLYQELGEDGFFIVRPVRPFWLGVSGRLRRLQLERWVHWLPGVRRHPYRRNAWLVDRRWARWWALELFHLMGMRRLGRSGRFLLFAQRHSDQTPPAPDDAAHGDDDLAD